MEQIALDMGSLLCNQFPHLRHRSEELRAGGLVTRLRRGGEILLEEYGLDQLGEVARASSDTVRGWCAMAIGAARGIPLEERFARIRPFADDPHFAVREWAWLSVRVHVASQIDEAVQVLESWTGSPSFKVRRFSVEVTRPRGVWGVHIPELKRSPDIGLPILEPLRSDDARYVQDSVANWINDASKATPQWAFELCASWRETGSSATERICYRALRTLRQKRQLALDLRDPNPVDLRG